MKVLLVNFDRGWGGGQEQMSSLALALRREGCGVHFLCRSMSPSARAFAGLGFPVGGVSSGVIGGFRAIARIATVLRRERFDVVMVTREHDLLRTMLAWQLAFPLAKPGKFVMAYHTATSRRQPLLGLADAIVCVSSFVRDRLLTGNGGVTVPLTVIPNGIAVSADVSPQKFSLQRERLFFKGEGFPLIGMVGAFFKNQVELIDVAALVREAFPSLVVALVGDDSVPGLCAPIRARIAEAGLEGSVVFTGKVPHERMAEVFYDLDLSVSTYRNEGFGLVHLESLAAGTPVVAYANGGQVDILQGSGAGVLGEGGMAEFAAAVTGLLHDHERRFAMGRRGVELVKSAFSLEEMGRKYLEFFESLAAGRRGGGGDG